MSRHASLACMLIALLAVVTLAQADSHVRIVRLSSVEGTVQMDRATGEGLERAILNTPILEGTRIVTGSDGLAEVEFENQSALRLTNDSEVKFTELLMNDAGDKTNQIDVVKGLVYLDTASKGNDTYILHAGDTAVVAHRDTVLRLNASAEQFQVAVFKGDAQYQRLDQLVTVHKKETLTADLKDGSNYSVAGNVEPDRYDAWNKEREAYSKTYAESEGYGGPNRGYGLQDLNYYGDFFYASGYGYVWQPYGFAGSMLSWDPYSNGAWMFYPGAGYLWASSYPWGWLPFHYGSWAYLKNTGWVWAPGRYSGQWYANSFTAVPTIAKAPANWKAPSAPAANAQNKTAPTVIVGKGSTKPLTIPGGRIPPNFASLVPGRTTTTAAAHGVARSNAAGSSVFASPRNEMSAVHQGAPGHVFAPPPGRSVFFDPEMEEMRGGSRTAGPPVAPSSHASAASAPAPSAAHK